MNRVRPSTVASRLYRRWASSNATHNSLRSFAAAQAEQLVTKESSAAHAVWLYNQVRKANIPLDKSIASNFLSALALHPDALLRDDILSQMRERWIPMETEHWHDVVAGCAREGQMEMAMEAVEEMKEQGVAIQPWLSDMLIFMLCDLGEVDQALEILKDRIRAGETAFSFLDKGIPTLKSHVWYYLFDAACTTLNYSAISFIWLHQMNLKYINPTAGQCLAVLQSAARNADVSLATRVFEVLSERSFTFESQHYQLLVETYIGAEDYKSALTVLCIMHNAGLTPHQQITSPLQRSLTSEAPASISSRYASLNDEPPELSSAQQALQTLNDLRNSGRTIPVSVFNAVLVALIDTHGLLPGIDMYHQCEHLVGKPDTSTFDELLRVCRHAKFTPADETEDFKSTKDTAVYLISEMLRLQIQPTALSYDRLILVFLEDDMLDDQESQAAIQKNFDNAMRYFGEMLGAGFAPRRSTYDEMIRRACDLGDQRIRPLLDSMTDAKYDTTSIKAYIRTHWKGPEL